MKKLATTLLLAMAGLISVQALANTLPQLIRVQIHEQGSKTIPGQYYPFTFVNINYDHSSLIDEGQDRFSADGPINNSLCGKILNMGESNGELFKANGNGQINILLSRQIDGQQVNCDMITITRDTTPCASMLITGCTPPDSAQAVLYVQKDWSTKANTIEATINLPGG